jgi:hypothetical protein
MVVNRRARTAGALLLTLGSALAGPYSSGAGCRAEGPDWPGAGSLWVTERLATGSFGAGSSRVTTLLLGERLWRGRPAIALQEGAEVLYLDQGHRLLARTRDGRVVESYEPGDPILAWPLFLGRTWQAELAIVPAGDRSRGRHVVVDARVEAYEETRTQAGRFAAFRVARDGGAERVLLWWSPDLGIVIKEERQRTAVHRLGAGTLRLQLVTYSMAPDPDP